MAQRAPGKPFNPANRIIPEVFEEMLSERGLSVADFVEKSGLSRSTIECARRGKPLTARTLRKIGETLESIPVRPTVLRLLGKDRDARD